MLLGDEYRPTSFDALTFHPVLTAQLRRVASTHDMPHLLLYGPDGGGKKTRVTCILRHLYGPLATHLSVDEKTFEYVTPSKRDEIKVTVVASTFHVELNPSDFGAQDSLVIQELIKDLARGRTINSLGPSTLRSHTNAVVSSTSTAPTGTVPTTDHATGQMRAPFSVVVLHDVDRLSKHAQHALRRTMEKYTAYCRLILVCRNRTKLIEPLCSRCLLVRVPLPTDDALLAHVQQIAADQHLRAEPALLEQIVRSARGHIGRALRRLDTCRLLGTPTAVQSEPPVRSFDALLMDHELARRELLQLMCGDHSMNNMVKVRAHLHEMLLHNAAPEALLRDVLVSLLTATETLARTKPEHRASASAMIHHAALYDLRLRTGAKASVHLDAFVAHCMTMPLIQYLSYRD